MRISDWSSDVCSSDLPSGNRRARGIFPEVAPAESVTRVSPKSQKGKIMKKLATAIALAAGLWAAAPAHAADGDPTKQAILQHYGDLAQAMYGDALKQARKLQTAVKALVDKQSEASLKAARAAWIAERPW